MRLYLDLCSIQRPLDDQSQLRVRLEGEAVTAVVNRCKAGLAELVSSDVLRFENARNPHPVRRTHAEEVLAIAGVDQPLTPEIEARARVLEGFGVKPLDALHSASAEAVGAVYFCTCDDRLLRRARPLVLPPTKVVSPLELLTELGI
jgi:predicted nucleic acid-binding protein